MDLADRVAAALQRSVLPAVIARGGAVRVVAVEEGVATLEVRGSPGAVLPLAGRIQDLLGAAVPEITGVRIVGPHAELPSGPGGGSLAERVRAVLDAEINPVIAAHGGRVVLVEADRGWVHVRMEGGCQGCSLAEVTMARVLLLVPARTYRASDFLVGAGRLGLDLVVGSDGALPLSNRPIIPVDPGDLQASVDRLVARSGPVDAVVAVDTSMLVLAAAVAARMGLPHNPVDAVLASTDKAAQRRRWAAAGVAQPAFRVVPAGASQAALDDAAAHVGFPCVVKAVSLSGSQGVLRADDQAGAVAAARRIRQILDGIGPPAEEPLLVEAYVPGWELSIDALLTDGHLTVTAIFDKPDTPNGPTFEETMLVTPSRLPQPLLSETVGTAARAAAALGLRYGPIHAELRLHARGGQQRPTMLE